MPVIELVGRVGPLPDDAGLQAGIACPFHFGGVVERTVIVGQRVQQVLLIDPGVTLVSSLWVVTGCEPVANYVATDAMAILEPLIPPPPNAMEYGYCFTRPGTAKLTVSVSVLVTCSGGLPAAYRESHTVTYEVLAPRLEGFAARTYPPDLYDTSGGRKKFAATGPQAGVAGFTVRGRVSATTPEMTGGRLRDLQTLLSLRILDQGVTYSGDYVLDGSVPYGGYGMLPPPGGSTEWSGQDSPNVAMAPERRAGSVSEVFRYYLQYKPPGEGSIWVTLARWDWYWGISAQCGPDGAWTITERRFAYQDLPDNTLRAVPSARDLPVWEDNIELVDDRGGPAPGAVQPTDPLSVPVVAAAAPPGLRPVPTSGPWQPEERHPSSPRDGRQPQSGRQLVIFEAPPPEPYDPRHPTDPLDEARKRVADRIGIALGPDVVRPEQRYFLAWCWPDLLAAWGYRGVRVLPQDLRCEGLDVRPLPERRGLLQAFHISVAPFCWGGDPAYWRLYAHEPLDGPEDYTLGGCERALRRLADAAGCPVAHGRQLDAGTLEVVFRGMPPMDLIVQIAALPQVARVLNYFGPLPAPYPDDM